MGRMTPPPSDVGSATAAAVAAQHKDAAVQRYIAQGRRTPQSIAQEQRIDRAWSWCNEIPELCDDGLAPPRVMWAAIKLRDLHPDWSLEQLRATLITWWTDVQAAELERAEYRRQCEANEAAA